MIIDLQELIIPNVAATAYIGLLLPDYTTARGSVLKNLTEERATALWSDSRYGMKNATSMTAWGHAHSEGMYSGAAHLLREYF
jgi:hypothetical protein